MRTIEATTLIHAPLTARRAGVRRLEPVHHGRPRRAGTRRAAGAADHPARQAFLHLPAPHYRGLAGGEVGWLGRLVLPGLCDADHEFHLTPSPEGHARLVQRETFRGVLVPLLTGMLEPTRRGFEAMNTALRQRVEARNPQDSAALRRA